MVQYKKGDTIKLYGESIGIVLDSGMSGREFYNQQRGSDILELHQHQSPFFRRFYMVNEYLENHVWYSVLMGDEKGWYGEYIIQEYIVLAMNIYRDENE